MYVIRALLARSLRRLRFGCIVYIVGVSKDMVVVADMVVSHGGWRMIYVWGIEEAK